MERIKNQTVIYSHTFCVVFQLSLSNSFPRNERDHD
jgi:hypothetical protein